MTVLDADFSRSAVNRKLIQLIVTVAVGTGVFLSGFVIREPAPYELFMVALMAVWAFFGLKFPRSIMPLLVLLVLFNLGGLVAMSQMEDLYETPLYLAVTLFLSFTAVFYAAIIRSNPDFLKYMFNAYVAAAVVTTLLGIAGYFALFPGAEIFTRYGRATGAFEDPNVFGPYLVLPALYIIYRMLTGRTVELPLLAITLLIIFAGVFLSFSRGAWGLFAISIVLLIGALFLQKTSGRFRLRILIVSTMAFVLLTLALLIALQIPSIAELFTSRAKLVQEYDSWRLGRFARHGLGFLLAMEKPLGIGALEFGREFGEDTHNIWLKALLDYSWLGFVSYLILTFWTLASGFRILFRERPWQPYLLCAYIAFTGHILLGALIDMDHWRHFYLLLGLVWGGIALERRHQAARSNFAPTDQPFDGTPAQLR